MNSVLLDTGSSDTLMPRQAFGTFKSILGRLVKGSMRKSADGNLCFKNNNLNEMYDSIPLFVITLDGGIEIKAPFANFIYKKQKNHICTTVFEHGNMIIGGNTLMDHFIYFDRDNRKVGVRQTQCKHIKEALHRQESAKQITMPDTKTPVTPDTKNPGLGADPVMPAVNKVSIAPMTIEKSASGGAQTPALPGGEAKAEKVIPTDERLMAQNQPESPNLYLTWELLLFGICTLSICVYAYYRMPTTKHEYSAVALEDMSDNQFEEEFNDEDHLNSLMNDNDESGKLP